MPRPYPLPDFESIRVRNLHGLQLVGAAPSPFFNELTRLASIVAETPFAAISWVDVDRLIIAAKVGVEYSEIPRAESLCTYTILHPEKALVIADAVAEEAFKEHPLVRGSEKVRSYAGFPIVSPDFGLPIGALCVFDRVPHDWSEDQLRLLREIARSVMNVLD